MKFSRRELSVRIVVASMGMPYALGQAPEAMVQCTPKISGNLWWYHPDSFTLAH